MHGAIELSRQQSKAHHANELSGGVSYSLLHADFDTALCLRQRSVQLRPVQIAPQKLTAEVLSRRRGKRRMRGRIRNAGARFPVGRKRDKRFVRPKLAPFRDEAVAFFMNVTTPELIPAVRRRRAHNAPLTPRFLSQNGDSVRVEAMQFAVGECHFTKIVIG
ncbi:MAG: hypothetical protein H0W66_08220 [Chthoniobacterales bacterium]|nr:hypothetical protein [Chthoniobacterales bacterium]